MSHPQVVNVFRSGLHGAALKFDDGKLLAFEPTVAGNGEVNGIEFVHINDGDERLFHYAARQRNEGFIISRHRSWSPQNLAQYWQAGLEYLERQYNPADPVLTHVHKVLSHGRADLRQLHAGHLPANPPMPTEIL